MGAVLSYVPTSTAVHAPFASAEWGERPARRSDWLLSNRGQPLALGRSTRELARSMYSKTRRW